MKMLGDLRRPLCRLAYWILLYWCTLGNLLFIQMYVPLIALFGSSILLPLYVAPMTFLCPRFVSDFSFSGKCKMCNVVISILFGSAGNIAAGAVHIFSAV